MSFALQNSKVKNPTNFYQSRRVSPSVRQHPVALLHAASALLGASMRRLVNNTKAFALGLLQERYGSNPDQYNNEFCFAKLQNKKRLAFFITEQEGFEPSVPFRGTTP